MSKPLLVAVIATLVCTVTACGRDNNQEKIGGTAAHPEKAAPMPDGTKTGGRTTAPPK